MKPITEDKIETFAIEVLQSPTGKCSGVGSSLVSISLGGPERSRMENRSLLWRNNKKVFNHEHLPVLAYNTVFTKQFYQVPCKEYIYRTTTK